MRELSLFADESGDTAYQSNYYLLTLVFHDQSDSISELISHYGKTLQNATLPDIPFHLSPLLNGNKDYSHFEISTRKQLLTRFFTFVRLSPIKYKTFLYDKSEVSPEKLLSKIKQDIIYLLFENLEYFQRYDTIKIYYDDGQKLITNSLKAAIDYVISKNAVLFKDGDPFVYRLSQAADLLCGFELLAKKFEVAEQTTTDEIFFINKGNFKNNYLQKIRKKVLH